jgi:hypothetical protein
MTSECPSFRRAGRTAACWSPPGGYPARTRRRRPYSDRISGTRYAKTVDSAADGVKAATGATSTWEMPRQGSPSNADHTGNLGSIVGTQMAFAERLFASFKIEKHA